MADFREERVSISERGHLRLHPQGTEFGTYAMGEFVDRRGFVSVYQQDPDRTFKKGYTRLDAIIGGKLVYRTWDQKLGRNVIYREAREMLDAK